MGREKQIYDAGQLYSDSMDEFQRYHTYPKGAFIDGAKWADETIINKACVWLSTNKDNYIIDIEGETIVDATIIEDFRKAMEG